MTKLRLVKVTNDLGDVTYEIQYQVFWFWWMKYKPYWYFSDRHDWTSYEKASKMLEYAREREAQKVLDDIQWKRKNTRHVEVIKNHDK